MIYRIWCEVSGGVTGSREGWLRDEGEIWQTTDRERARQEAAELRASAGMGPVRFQYTVKVKRGASR